jgi:NAD-dependent dihydropyrimidine dehydrogenase PreA subunit
MFLYRSSIIIVALLFCFAGDFALASRNPPPVFETDYILPETETPVHHPPIATINAVSLGVYCLFLVIAGLAVHHWRSRKTLFCLAVCSIFILGFWLHVCPCPVGMFQNLVQAIVDPAAVVSWTVVLLFALPLVAALFWGRIFCSSVCPLGAIQELTTIKNLPVSDRVEHVLGLFRYFWLGIGVFCVVVGLGYIVCRFDPYVAFFHFGALYPVLIFAAVVLGIGMLVGRPFCRFMCPYGTLLGMCSSLASRNVTITPGNCEQCKLCEHVCPYNAILPPTAEPTTSERRYGPWKLLGTLLALPVIVFVFAQLGGAIAPRLTTLHQDVFTAQLLLAEEEKWVEASGTFPETRGLIQCGTSSEEVYQRALDASKRFRIAGGWLGAWIGLVIGIKWISLSLRYRRADYVVDPARCVACGRCFWYCPNQKEQRLLLIT